MNNLMSFAMVMNYQPFGFILNHLMRAQVIHASSMESKLNHIANIV